MKARHWAAIVVIVTLLALAALLLTGNTTAWVEVRCDGELLRRIPLSRDGSYTISTDYGENVLLVRGGQVVVSSADCPGGDCTRMTLTPGGAIVCLPHHLVIAYAQDGGIDGISG